MSEKKTIGQKLRISRLTWLHWLTIAAGLASLVFEEWYSLIFTVLLVVPVIGLGLGLPKGRPSIGTFWNEDDQEDWTDPVDYLLIAGIAMILKTSELFQFDSIISMIVPSLVILVVMIGFAFITHRPQDLKKKGVAGNYIVLIIYLAAYSLGACMGVNCVYDQSPQTSYAVTVVDKHDHYSKSNSERNYYFKTTPWGSYTEPQQIVVSTSLYNGVEEGEVITIVAGQGLLNIPWYKSGL